MAQSRAGHATKLVWENLIIPLALYGILWAGFHYWLDFTNIQSIVFTVLFGSCYEAFKELRKKTEKAEDFIPYRVSITIHNQRDLLLKFKLVKTEDEWNQLAEKVEESSFLRRGLNFTVLSLSKEGVPHLIWWEDHQIFQAGSPSFEAVIEEVKIRHDPPLMQEWSPRLYFGFRHGKGRGYTFALSLWEEWWDKNKSSETERTETDKQYDTGSVYLILGTLPYGEIENDYEKRGQDRKTELAKFGWTIKDYYEPGAPKYWNRLEVQNEYFSVAQQDCETN